MRSGVVLYPSRRAPQSSNMSPRSGSCSSSCRL
ncbi:hypothetical protein Taro_025324 [Colocasia esculenta]|uniref:Uncharacterized protein n=1 Tax=Colocasia esculenta TaxID=4460 RepID=A0A843VH97_COLES|nr:hypothetical protein [Colocasia esculenta]